MIVELLTMLAWAALVLVGGLLVAFLFLLRHEHAWQREHVVELERERRLFEQPLVRQLREPGFLFGKPLYVILRDYPVFYQGRRWVVMEGEETDLASVPRPLWSVTGYLPDGPHRAAAVGHDDLCKYRYPWSNWLDAADFFRHYQRLAYVRPAKIVARYLAVVVFGPKWRRKDPVKSSRS